MSNHEPSDLDRELASFERLTADISSRFNLLSADELPSAIEGTLQRIVEALDVDRSTVLELSKTEDVVEAMHFWARPGISPLRLPDVEGRSLASRPAAAWRDRATLPTSSATCHPKQPPSGPTSDRPARSPNMTVPVSIGGRLVSALAVGTFRQLSRLAGAARSSACGSSPRSSGRRCSDAGTNWPCARAWPRSSA